MVYAGCAKAPLHAFVIQARTFLGIQMDHPGACAQNSWNWWNNMTSSTASSGSPMANSNATKRLRKRAGHPHVAGQAGHLAGRYRVALHRALWVAWFVHYTN